ncbi:hypothetical protein OFO11_31950, partial [Escherichia coli]|nr:hypothetical protein [Escherichia coli]
HGALSFSEPHEIPGAWDALRSFHREDQSSRARERGKDRLGTTLFSKSAHVKAQPKPTERCAREAA